MINNIQHIYAKIRLAWRGSGRGKRRGFTLIETLLAILVLTVSIVGPLTIASRGLNAALIAKNKTIAFFLAQDAIEFVRYKRDTNRLSNVPWLDGLESCVSASGTAACTILSISDTTASCPSDAGVALCPTLNYNSSTNVYSYDAPGGTIAGTRFVRSVSITNTNPDPEAKVIVTVSWTDVGTIVHTITVRESLFNWQ